MPFVFKKFNVNDERCEMKVGTDGVLLGAWVRLESAQNALDIGTGCGVIALMMAQRSTTLHIDAVEMLSSDAEQASENIAASPWSNRVNVFHKPIQNFESTFQYDVIVTNPPFFVNSTPPPDRQRASVRHTLTLSHHQLLEAVGRLLSPRGRFSIILPSTTYSTFVAQAADIGLLPRRVLTFRTRPGRPAERHLVEFTFEPEGTAEEAICLYAAPFDRATKDNWSDAYKTLVSDFYL